MNDRITKQTLERALADSTLSGAEKKIFSDQIDVIDFNATDGNASEILGEIQRADKAHGGKGYQTKLG